MARKPLRPAKPVKPAAKPRTVAGYPAPQAADRNAYMRAYMAKRRAAGKPG